MENLTHSLVGLAAAKAGLERLSPAATTACVVAANAPDIDLLTALGGRWAYLHHHRGITHSIAGTLALALLVASAFYISYRIIARVRQKPSKASFRGLLLASLIVSATHPLMDWTNNYGLRPLLPWSAEWYYGDLVYITDPWLWLCIGGAAFLLTTKNRWQVAGWKALALFLTVAFLVVPLKRTGLLHPNIFRALWITGLFGLALLRRTQLARRWGSAVALVALASVVVYWGGLSIIHQLAFGQAQSAANLLAARSGETTRRLAVMPTYADPLHWQCVTETDRATYRFELYLAGRNDQHVLGQTVRYEKPQGDAAAVVALASEDPRAKIFLGFARFPVTQIRTDSLSRTLVQFADLRYTEPGVSRGGAFSLEVALPPAP